MIISHRHKYIFVHIPKTGGSAFTLALEAGATQDDLLISDTPKALAQRDRIKADPATARLNKHSPLSELGALLQPDYFCFTLVRNPWDRKVSYYHWLRVQSFDHPAVTLAKALDFSKFLNHPSTQMAELSWPAHAYMRDATGAPRANLFLRIEHLETDIAPLEAHLGFSILPLPVYNTSQRQRDWRVYYSDADAALISRICAADIRQFAYRFDP